MALDKAALQAALKAALNDPGQNGDTQDIYTTRVAANLANAIDTYVKTGKATLPAASVVTTGSATTQTGPAAPVQLSIS